MPGAWGGKVIIFVQDYATSSVDCIPVTGLLQFSMLWCKKTSVCTVLEEFSNCWWKSVARSTICGQGHKRLCLQRVGMPKHKRSWPRLGGVVKRQGGAGETTAGQKKVRKKDFCPMSSSDLARQPPVLQILPLFKRCSPFPMFKTVLIPTSPARLS